MRTHFRGRALLAGGLVMMAVGLLAGARLASAQCEGFTCPVIPAEQFDTTGFIQAATLDPTCSGDVRCGGTVTVNDQLYEVPFNTIMQFPASTHTWQEVFTMAPPPYGPLQSGLATTDVPTPSSQYEIRVMGNRVRDAFGADHWIAGLIYASQSSLMGASGHVNFINHATGEMRVGGILGNPLTGRRVSINDPVHRFTSAAFLPSPDPRFSVDDRNPTILTGAGYPGCLADVTPPGSDPKCPLGNRPIDPASGLAKLTFQMNPPAFTPGGDLLHFNLDPTLPAPILVGDFIEYSGTLLQDANGDYISAHTIAMNVQITTTPGVKPAYTMIEVVIFGTGGTTIAGVNEATARTKVEGFTTDVLSTVSVYAADVDPCTGADTFPVSDCRAAGDPEPCCTGLGTGTCRPLRLWATGVEVDPGPPNGAIPGRWRWRPGSGAFQPPTREAAARSSTGVWYDKPGAPVTLAGEVRAGQYHFPIGEFIPPENRPGNPIPESNFLDFPFLAQGSGPWDDGSANPPLVGQLSPWPGSVVPATITCGPFGQVIAPTANAGPDFAGFVNSPITLSAAASTDNNVPPLGLTFAWTQTGGPAVALSTPGAVTTDFITPTAGTYTFSVNVCVAGFPAICTSDSVSVFVANATTPQVTVQTIAPVASGATFSLIATATDSPLFLPLTFQWTQITGTPLLCVNTNTLTVSCQAPAIPTGNPAQQFTFRFKATNNAGGFSTADTVVTVNPQADIVTITLAQYRVGKARLTINATDNILAPAPVLESFWTDSFGVEHSLGPMAPLGGGLYSTVTAGFPLPVSVRVHSSLGGNASTNAITIRN